MAYRIRHIPTGRFLKKRSGLGTSVNYALGGMNSYYTLDVAIKMATTTGIGYLWGTKQSAQKILDMLTISGKHYDKLPPQPNDWEIVEG